MLLLVTANGLRLLKLVQKLSVVKFQIFKLHVGVIMLLLLLSKFLNFLMHSFEFAISAEGLRVGQVNVQNVIGERANVV